MHTVSVTFTHHATMLGMVEIFKPAVQSLYADRLTGADVFGSNTTTRVRLYGNERFYSHLPFHDGAVTLLSIVDRPIGETESLDVTEHTLIVTAPDAVAVATQVLDLLAPETVDAPKLDATPFDPEHPDCRPIAGR